MTPLLRHAFRAIFALAVLAGPVRAAEPLAEHLWVSRPLIIFADTPLDPSFSRQLAELEREKDALAERDVVIITDTDPGASRSERSALRKMLRPHGFTVILIGKDGEIALRRPVVVTADDITRQVDRMPDRLREMGRP